MRIDHALGPPGGARGITHPHRLVLVLFGIAVAAGVRGDEILVVLVAGRQRRAAEREYDDARHFRQQRLHLFPDRQQHVVDQDHLVIGIADDVSQVLGRKPQVEGMQHRPRRRNAEIGFQMRPMVPHQRADRLATPDAGVLQRLRELARALVDRAVIAPIQGLVRPARHHLAAGIKRVGVLEQLIQAQGRLHHGGSHFSPPDSFLGEAHPSKLRDIRPEGLASGQKYFSGFMRLQ